MKERIVRLEKETAKVEAEARLIAARHAAMIEAFGKQVRPRTFSSVLTRFG